jgi:hypothetical protein
MIQAHILPCNLELWIVSFVIGIGPVWFRSWIARKRAKPPHQVDMVEYIADLSTEIWRKHSGG